MSDPAPPDAPEPPPPPGPRELAAPRVVAAAGLAMLLTFGTCGGPGAGGAPTIGGLGFLYGLAWPLVAGLFAAVAARGLLGARWGAAIPALVVLAYVGFYLAPVAPAALAPALLRPDGAAARAGGVALTAGLAGLGILYLVGLALVLGFGLLGLRDRRRASLGRAVAVAVGVAAAITGSLAAVYAPATRLDFLLAPPVDPVRVAALPPGRVYYRAAPDGGWWSRALAADGRAPIAGAPPEADFALLAGRPRLVDLRPGERRPPTVVPGWPHRDGLIALPGTGPGRRLALSTPFHIASVQQVTLLPGDLVVCRVGPNDPAAAHVYLADVPHGQATRLAAGTDPVVVLAPARPQPPRAPSGSSR